jgi:hypothetical protein
MKKPPPPQPTMLSLQAPRSPGARGDDGRWVLHVGWPGGGVRTALPGPRPDESDKAMAEAAGILGYEPKWEKVVAQFPDWPPAWVAVPRKSSRRKTR